MQWAMSIGRWEIQTAVMIMSSLRTQPRKGYMERVKRIYGHLSRFTHFKIRFRTDEPDLSAFDNNTIYSFLDRRLFGIGDRSNLASHVRCPCDVTFG